VHRRPSNRQKRLYVGGKIDFLALLDAQRTLASADDCVGGVTRPTRKPIRWHIFLAPRRRLGVGALQFHSDPRTRSRRAMIRGMRNDRTRETEPLRVCMWTAPIVLLTTQPGVPIPISASLSRERGHSRRCDWRWVFTGQPKFWSVVFRAFEGRHGGGRRARHLLDSGSTGIATRLDSPRNL